MSVGSQCLLFVSLIGGREGVVCGTYCSGCDVASWWEEERGSEAWRVGFMGTQEWKTVLDSPCFLVFICHLPPRVLFYVAVRV